MSTVEAFARNTVLGTARTINAVLARLAGISIVRVSHENWLERDARNGLRTIEEHYGTKLPPRLKSLADDYAVEILGDKKYAPWLYVYSMTYGSFREGWIPDNYYGEIVLPHLHKDIRTVLTLKTFPNLILKTDLFPDLGYYIGGNFYDTDYVVVGPESLFKSIREVHPDVFVKKDGPGRGMGVSKLASGELNQDQFKKLGNCVIQAPVKQHEAFEEMVPGPVATVRITTVKELDGKITVRSASLRLGRQGASWVAADNAVRIPVVSDRGDLDRHCYLQRWIRSPHHPDTKVRFESRRVPRFEEAAAQCVKLHASVPHFSIIGWDLTVTDDSKIKLLEWNGFHSGIKFSEATLGPCLRGLNWERLGKDAA